jgi:hypothetical protein
LQRFEKEAAKLQKLQRPGLNRPSPHHFLFEKTFGATPGKQKNTANRKRLKPMICKTKVKYLPAFVQHLRKRPLFL